MLSGTQANIAIKLFGEDLNKMYSLGQEIKQAIADVDGITDVRSSNKSTRPTAKSFPVVNAGPLRVLLADFPNGKCRVQR